MKNLELNEMKNENRIKFKCALIGQDGNIFNLMVIESRTLKKIKCNKNLKRWLKEY